MEINIRQVCIPVGCVPLACWPYLPACTAQGGSAPGGVCSGGGGLLPGGVCSRGVCYPSMHSTCLEVSVFKWWLWKRSVSDTNVAKVIPGYPISLITNPHTLPLQMPYPRVPYPHLPEGTPLGSISFIFFCSFQQNNRSRLAPNSGAGDSSGEPWSTTC